MESEDHGAQPSTRLPDILVDFVGNPVQSLELCFRLLWSVSLHQLLDSIQAQEQMRDELGHTIVEFP